MSTNKIIIGVILAVLVIGAAFFMLRPQSTTDDTAIPTGSVSTLTTSTPPAATQSGGATNSAQSSTSAEVKEFTVNGSNFKFEPATMTVNQGDTVRITFKNTGGFHDLTIDEFNVKTKQLGANAEETVEFVADKAGTYEYYCSVGQHRQMGMKGTLTVR
jgi:plastocyanin